MGTQLSLRTMTTNTNGENQADRRVLGPTNPWLSQGDVFEQVPLISVSFNAGELSAKILRGPAMLITHDCALDKRSGTPPRAKVSRLHLARVLSTMSLAKDKQKELRSRWDRIDPSEIMYLGWLSEFGECYADLSDLSAVPSEFFEVQLASVEVAAGEGDLRLVASASHARVGSMSRESRELLTSKLMKYWTRLKRITPNLPSEEVVQLSAPNETTDPRDQDATDGRLPE